ncbi:MAG TPA: riboflavin synthase [Candidatus Dormibacteraeota bacterium]|nr:riboflavin synthase [Candidatus Dormibacteraeota bacterium]
MFTGIISAVGVVVEAGANRLGIEHAATSRRLKVGASVAVNGCCLTVVRRAGAAFFMDVVPETQRRTDLGTLRPGSRVNLELPLAAGGLLDGHLVQGHIDATAAVKQAIRVAAGREVTIELPVQLRDFVVEKGSIAVDGVSLTVAGLDEPAGTFTVALVPHTLAATIADGYGPGTVVNLEADIIARYVARNLRR